MVAALRRWTMRDNAGVWLSRFGMRLAVVDDRTLSLATPSPTPVVELALSAPADPPFIMRERDAVNPPEKAVAEIVGSDPVPKLVATGVSVAGTHSYSLRTQTQTNYKLMRQ